MMPESARWETPEPGDLSGGLPWYALHVRSRHERVSETILRGKGYETYVPLFRKKNRWSDRVQEVDQPLFAGYVFCRFDANKRLPILTTPGVVSVIGFGRLPAPLEMSELEAVRQLAGSARFAEPCPYLRTGQRVRVRTGALTGLEGILVSKKTEWRFVISVSLLQRSVSTEIDRECLESLPGESAVN